METFRIENHINKKEMGSEMPSHQVENVLDAEVDIYEAFVAVREQMEIAKQKVKKAKRKKKEAKQKGCKKKKKAEKALKKALEKLKKTEIEYQNIVLRYDYECRFYDLKLEFQKHMAAALCREMALVAVMQYDKEKEYLVDQCVTEAKSLISDSCNGNLMGGEAYEV